MKYLEDHSDKGLGNFRFAAIANVPAYTPFYPASYHQGLGHQFAIALESANVVAAVMAVQRDPEATRQALISELGRNAVADRGYRQQDRSGDRLDVHGPRSFSRADEICIDRIGDGGIYRRQIRHERHADRGRHDYVGVARHLREKSGIHGVMMPVLEDTRLAQLWGEGALTMDQLLAYSAVCGTGLDTIPLPGDVTTQQLERIIGDVATLSVKLSKPLSARLLPSPAQSRRSDHVR